MSGAVEAVAAGAVVPVPPVVWAKAAGAATRLASTIAMIMAFFIVILPYFVTPQASLTVFGSESWSPSKRVSKVSVSTLMLSK